VSPGSPSSPDFADGFDATSRLVAYGTGRTSQTTAPDAPQEPNAGYDACRALLYQGPGGHLWAYQATSGQTRASGTPCCRYTVMAAAPSRSG
jgi:hypothetical protein